MTVPLVSAPAASPIHPVPGVQSVAGGRRSLTTMADGKGGPKRSASCASSSRIRSHGTERRWHAVLWILPQMLHVCAACGRLISKLPKHLL